MQFRHRWSDHRRTVAKLNCMEAYYTWPLDSLQIFLRYFVIAGLTYFIFYHWKRNRFRDQKLQPAIPSRKRITREVLYSIMTLSIFCGVSWLTIWATQQGYSQIYTNVEEYGNGYLFLSFTIMVLMHDTYFYWTHRFMHMRSIFPLVHRIHHHSHNPDPWSAFSFHPLEAILATGIIPLIVFTLPCHPFALFGFLTYMTLINVLGHLGYEILPKRFRENRFGKYHNSATHHNLHHQEATYNFGLYFTLWDRWMGTFSEKQND